MTDPTRRPAFLCSDCTTVGMVAAAAPGHDVDDEEAGAVVAVVHDDSCPWLSALPDEERVQVDDHGAVVHYALSDLGEVGARLYRGGRAET